MSDVTGILSAIESGDPHAAHQLLPLVYDELRKLAASMLAQENEGQTLQATALVHEAYLRLVASPAGEVASEEASAPREQRRDPHWNSRGHFFAAVAEAMRRILIDQARQKHSQRRGGGQKRQPLDQVEIAAPEPSLDVLALNEALERFAKIDRVKAELVKLRYFAA